MNWIDPSGHATCDEVGHCWQYGRLASCGAWDDTCQPVNKISKPSGLLADGYSAWKNMNKLGALARESEIILTEQDWLAYIIATEFLGSLGASLPWIEAMTRRYWNFCSSGAFSVNCFNGFWAYMEGTVRYKQDLFNYWFLQNAEYQNVFEEAQKIAWSILHPAEKNSYRISPAMNSCTSQKCDWALIKPEQNDFYDYISDLYDQKAPWVFSTPGGFDILLTVDMLVLLCNGTHCNLTQQQFSPTGRR